MKNQEVEAHVQTNTQLKNDHDVAIRKLATQEQDGNKLLDKLKLSLKGQFDDEKKAQSDTINKLMLQLSTLEESSKRKL